MSNLRKAAIHVSQSHTKITARAPRTQNEQPVQSSPHFIIHPEK